jgi:hypothetical protein
MYFIHYVKDVKDELTKNVRAWAEKAKASGKIRFFGFSAHKNMESSILEAAKLGWIDGIMMSYNYRLMVKDKMKRAVDACAKAGIGLTAMKTQAAFTSNLYASIGSETDHALKMTNALEKDIQRNRKLKVVWENRIFQVPLAMPNMTTAAHASPNKKTVSHASFFFIMPQIFPATAAGRKDCESAVDWVPIAIYCVIHAQNSYGDEIGRKVFKGLEDSKKTSKDDYSKAEAFCPQNNKLARYKEHEALS